LIFVQIDAVVVTVTGVRYKKEKRASARNAKRIPRRVRLFVRLAFVRIFSDSALLGGGKVGDLIMTLAELCVAKPECQQGTDKSKKIRKNKMSIIIDRKELYDYFHSRLKESLGM